MITDAIDELAYEGIEKFIVQLSQINYAGSKLLMQQNKTPILNDFKSMPTLAEQITDFLKIENEIVQQNQKQKIIQKLLQTLEIIAHYVQESLFQYSLVLNYLDKKESLKDFSLIDQDNRTLCYLRFQKRFIIEIFCIYIISNEIVSDQDSQQTLIAFLYTLKDHLKIFYSLNFSSFGAKTIELVNLVEDYLIDQAERLQSQLKEKVKQKQQRHSVQFIYSKLNVKQQKYSWQLSQLIDRLVLNQQNCQELYQNIKFIIRQELKQNNSRGLNNQSKAFQRQITSGSAYLDSLKTKFSSGDMKIKQGLLNFPNLGPMELLQSTQIYNKEVNLQDVLDDEQLRQVDNVTKKVSGKLTDELLQEILNGDNTENLLVQLDSNRKITDPSDDGFN